MNIEELEKYIKEKLVKDYRHFPLNNSEKITGFIINKNEDFSKLENYTIRCIYNDVIYKPILNVKTFAYNMQPGNSYYICSFDSVKIIINNYLLNISIDSELIVTQQLHAPSIIYHDHYIGPSNIENDCENFIPMFVKSFRDTKIYDLPIKLKKALMLV